MDINTIEAERYYIIECLGKGGNATVYKAKDLRTGCIVALKKFQTYDAHNMKRIMYDVEREINILKNITHPGLPKVFNIISNNEDVHLVMEYVEGQNLEEYVKNKKRLTRKELVDIGMQILSAMYYLHSLEPPIVYRDLKPSNIMIYHGKIKLIDFGNAQRFNRFAMGTPKFAAPEQFGDKWGNGLYNTDIRTDIYGVGSVLYYLSCGKRVGEQITFVDKILHRLRYGRRFENIIKKATRRNPSERFQNDLEMMLFLTK